MYCQCATHSMLTSACCVPKDKTVKRSVRWSPLVFLSTVSSLAAVRLTNWNPFFKFQPTAYPKQKRDYNKNTAHHLGTQDGCKRCIYAWSRSLGTHTFLKRRFSKKHHKEHVLFTVPLDEWGVGVGFWVLDLHPGGDSAVHSVSSSTHSAVNCLTQRQTGGSCCREEAQSLFRPSKQGFSEGYGTPKLHY